MPEDEIGSLFEGMDVTSPSRVDDSTSEEPGVENDGSEVDEKRTGHDGSGVEKDGNGVEPVDTPPDQTRARGSVQSDLGQAEDVENSDAVANPAHRDYTEEAEEAEEADEETAPLVRMPKVVATLVENLEALVRSPYNPRLQSDPKEIENLARGLSNGLAPLIFVRRKADGTYEILQGHRIVEALRQLGWTKAQVVVLDIPDDLDAAMYVVGTDRKTAPLFPWELMRAIGRLVVLAEGRITQKQIAARNGLRAPEVSEANTRNEALSDEVLALAGISEQTHSGQLKKLKRSHMRYIVDGPNGRRAAETEWAPEDVADRLKEVVLGDAPEPGLTVRVENITDAMTDEGTWTLTVTKLAEMSKVELDAVVKRMPQRARQAWKAAKAGNNGD